jgi:hypothetical protein
MLNYYIFYNNCDTGDCYCNEEFEDLTIVFPWIFKFLLDLIHLPTLLNCFTIDVCEDGVDFWFDTVEQFEIIPRKPLLVCTIPDPLTQQITNLNIINSW